MSEPHAAVVGRNEGTILNLVHAEASPARDSMLALACQNPDRTLAEARHLVMPRHHDVRASDVDLNRLGAVLATAYEKDLSDFASLLLVENLGPRTLQTLALVSEVVHGVPVRFADPARFSFALGGKDRHPFPVPLKTYDASIAVLRRSLDSARLGDPDKMAGFQRLDKLVRAVEKQFAPAADFEAVVAREKEMSASLDGRSVFDDKPTRRVKEPKRQLSLF